ncbi:MAG TPA: hypothetical protein VLB12_17015 [Gemmatimonadales bacterium]|nr:hypothetical protein [Gemmatimonadales bacterium]
MSHTLKVIAAGLALLVLFLLGGRWLGGANSAIGMARAALVFLPLWFIGAAINMWLGVTKAGYSVADEAPIFVVVFALPAVIALFVWWRISRG